MQRLLPIVAPSPKERRELYSICLENVDEVETWLPDWFTLRSDPKSHPKLDNICRDNVAEWISWAFFSSSLEDVLQDDTSNEELQYMIDHFESEFHIQFDLGYSEDIISHRINLDPVHAYHRPLAFYACIMFLTTLFRFLLQFVWGMKKYGPDRKSTLWEPMDSQERSYERLSIKNVPEKISYWFRDGDRSKKPIVFVHGVGVGLMSYITFIASLLQSTDSPIFFIELPWVSMHCVEEIPTMQETVDDIHKMLNHHGFDSVVFIGHSLGTSIISWPDVPHHAHSYTHSVKMPENTTVYLSGKDNIIDSTRVDTYLTHNGINSVFMKDLDHASFLFAPKWQKEIISTIVLYSNQKV
ncbi:hypothetical protein K501DRAFT_168253 [Backusella circina FSU 941]|nr:hypothetical protein K501DRAFT_168253 [Backusella circina FSU 941]